MTTPKAASTKPCEICKTAITRYIVPGTIIKYNQIVQFVMIQGNDQTHRFRASYLEISLSNEESLHQTLQSKAISTVL